MHFCLIALLLIALWRTFQSEQRRDVEAENNRRDLIDSKLSSDREADDLKVLEYF